VTLESVAFEGHDCVLLQGGGGSVMVTTSVGPRVLGLVAGESNLMAVLPDLWLERPDGGRFAFVGGHRLWAAPEVPELTYQPDDRPCAVTEIDGGTRIEAPADGAGLVKVIEIRRAPDGWLVDHELRNLSGGPLTMAPWAITQLRPGGEAILPMGAEGIGPQADRSLILWPYTDLADPRISIRHHEVRIVADPGPSPRKVGVAPSEGRVAYRIGRELFEKRIEVDPRATYADRGAAVQVYLCDEFCELETLGPLHTVAPGEALTHRERWTLRPWDTEGDR
jgi:hypothetical protein